MRPLLLLLPLLGACDNVHAIRTCKSETSDCCSSDDQCAEYYGEYFIFCLNPQDDEGGQCVECTTDVHCGLAGRCVEDEVLGRYCAP